MAKKSGQKSVEESYIRWNVAGIGNGHMSVGNWRFRKEVMYYQDRPFKRFVRDAKRLPIQLRRLSTQADPEFWKVAPTEAHWDNNIAYQYWTLPEIGVLSRYEDDMITPAELHERHKFLFFAELRQAAIDLVRPMAGADLEKQASSILSGIDKMYARYHNYSLTFGLKWTDMPKMYRDEVVIAINTKIERYHDPKSVAQRERTHARKIAKKAFGL